MRPKIENSMGSITISNNVIASICSHTMKSCYGVVGVATSKWKESFLAFATGGGQKKGINITSDENGLVIDLYIIVEYGVNIAAVSEIVMQSVKYQVESLTGFTVTKVSVNVASVRIDEGGNKVGSN